MTRGKGGPPAEDRAMRCPRDSTELDKVKADDVTYDRCPTCRGLWFDRGELARVAATDELEKAAQRIDPLAQLSSFGCIRCWGDCFQTRIGDVVVDTCRTCHGVWLDGGELEAAKKALQAIPKPTGFKALLKRL